MKKRKRQPWRVGDIVRIPRAGGKMSFGWVLEEPLIAYFDYESDHAPNDPAELLDREIAFKVWTMVYAIKKAMWPVLGNVLPPEDLLKMPWFFKVDPISGDLYKVQQGSGEDLPATPSDCMELERAAVWDPEHIVERLDDHFAGRPNVWVESLSFRPS